MSTVADPRQPQDTPLAQAKATLIRVAADIDPLAPLRAHPWATIAGAAAVGAIVGASTTRLDRVIQFARAVAAIVRPLALFSNRSAVRDPLQTSAQGTDRWDDDGGSRARS